MSDWLSQARLREHTAVVQLIGVVVCIPALLFPEWLPEWAAWGSIGGLTALLVIGYALTGRPFARTPLDVPILLLLLLLPVALLVTPDRTLTLPQVYKVVGSVALFYAVVGFFEEKHWFGLGALAIGIIGLAMAFLILFGTRWMTAKLFWLPFDLYQLVPGRIRPFWKPEGLNSNVSGGILAMLLPVSIAYLLFGRRRLVRIGALLEVGMVGLVLLFTQSRGAISALLAGAAAMLVVHGQRWLLAGACLIVGAVLVFQFVAVTYLEGTDPYVIAQGAAHSAEGRMELWSRGLMMLQDFAFTGIGFGALVKVMPLLYPTFVIPNDGELEHVHNLYLEAGVDLGLVGLVATLAILLILLHMAWRAARRARGTALESLASAMLGTVVVVIVHGFTDNVTFSEKAHFVAWALFGVVVAVGLRLLHSEEQMPSMEA